MSKWCRSGYFGRGGIKVRLLRASAMLRAFCKRTGRKVALKRFSQDNLCLKKGMFPVPQFSIHTFWGVPLYCSVVCLHHIQMHRQSQ